MSDSNCNMNENYEIESNVIFTAFVNAQRSLQTPIKVAIDAVIKLLKGKFSVYSWTIGAGAGQKPAGNTLQDNLFIGVTIDQVAIIITDNQAMNNISAQGITINSTTGTFDLTSIGGLKVGGPSGISIYLNKVKNQ